MMQYADSIAKRIETGPLRFGSDWPGVFIRGDDALGWSGTLRHLAQHGDSIQREHALNKLADLLATCSEKTA
jgi:hypothetical protein